MSTIFTLVVILLVCLALAVLALWLSQEMDDRHHRAADERFARYDGNTDDD